MKIHGVETIAVPKPCPFCGKPPNVWDRTITAPALKAARFAVGCSRRGHIVRVVGMTRDKAIRNWNRRRA